MSEPNNEEVEYEAKRESRRRALIDGVNESDKSRAAYEKARDAVRKEMELEELRRKKHDAKLRELNRAKHMSHGVWNAAEDCRGMLINEYVDPALLKAKDRALTTLLKLSRALDAAENNAATQRRIMATKDQKQIMGVMRDRNGLPLRGEVDPAKPHITPPLRRGKIPNPQAFRGPEQRKFFLARLEELELIVEEARAKVLAADKEARLAEDAYNKAVEEAFRG